MIRLTSPFISHSDIIYLLLSCDGNLSIVQRSRNNSRVISRLIDRYRNTDIEMRLKKLDCVVVGTDILKCVGRSSRLGTLAVLDSSSLRENSSLLNFRKSVFTPKAFNWYYNAHPYFQGWSLLLNTNWLYMLIISIKYLHRNTKITVWLKPG